MSEICRLNKLQGGSKVLMWRRAVCRRPSQAPRVDNVDPRVANVDPWIDNVDPRIDNVDPRVDNVDLTMPLGSPHWKKTILICTKCSPDLQKQCATGGPYLWVDDVDPRVDSVGPPRPTGRHRRPTGRHRRPAQAIGSTLSTRRDPPNPSFPDRPRQR